MSSEGDADGRRDADDEARFAKLYARCHTPIRDYCRRRVAADAIDDVVADIFLTAWRRLHQIPGGDEAMLWVYGVAYRVIGHQWRSTQRRRRLHDRLQSVGSPPVAAVDESTVDGDACRLVVAALARLGDTDAEVLRLVAWEQLSCAAIASVLGIEPDAARHRLQRASRNLAREHNRLQSRSISMAPAVTGGAR